MLHAVAISTHQVSRKPVSSKCLCSAIASPGSPKRCHFAVHEAQRKISPLSSFKSDSCSMIVSVRLLLSHWVSLCNGGLARNCVPTNPLHLCMSLTFASAPLSMAACWLSSFWDINDPPRPRPSLQALRHSTWRFYTTAHMLAQLNFFF